MRSRLIAPAVLAALMSATDPSPTGAEQQAVPSIKVNAGLRFDSEGAGTPNTLSGYALAPLSQDENGSIVYIDGFASALYGGQTEDNEFKFGGSARLGYRHLTSEQDWILGVNAGADLTGFDDENFYQVGAGLEALNRGVELRVNGYLPIGDTTYAQDYNGYSKAFLKNNKLYFADVQQDWYTSYSGGDIEIGLPLSRWNNGSIWAYAGYYYLDAALQQADSSSGVRGRLETRIHDNVAIGATVSYDNIFDTRATGYVRLGLTNKSLAGQAAKSTVELAEQQFLALRGLPVQRVRDVRANNVRINVGNHVAKKGATNIPWLVHCVGTNNPGNQCTFTNISGAISAGYSDYILAANGTNSNLGGARLNLSGGTQVLSGANAPIIETQFGPVNLKTVYGVGSGAAPTISNGTIGIGSNTTIEGLNFVDASITNYSTSNVRIAGNSFTGAADGAGAIRFSGVSDYVIANNNFVNASVVDDGGSNIEISGNRFKSSGNGFGAIQLNNSTNILVKDNTITELYAKTSSIGDAQGSKIGRGISAINSDEITISGNTVSGAVGEGIYIENIGISQNNIITHNIVTDLRVDLDTNLEAGIFVRNNVDGAIKIIGNTIADINQTEGEGYLPSDSSNGTDSIELNICRGGVHTSAFSAFTDDKAGSCSNDTTLTADVSNNYLYNLRGETDGIDFNVGDNGRLNVTVSNNSVTEAGDDAFTMDAWGPNIQTNVSISENTFKTTGLDKGDGMSFELDADTCSFFFDPDKDPQDPCQRGYTASGVHNISITNNTIEVDTENLAAPASKAEGIKLELGKGIKNGNISGNITISNNDIKTRTGDGIELRIAEQNASTKALEGITTLKTDIHINNNLLTQTNETPAGDDKDSTTIFALTYGKESDGNSKSIIQSAFQMKNNTLTMKAGAVNDPNAISLQGLSAQAESVYQFEITGNDLQQSAYKKLLMNVVEVPVPPWPLNNSAFKIVAPASTDTRKAFDDYLDSVNPGSVTSISSTSDPVQIEALDSFVAD